MPWTHSVLMYVLSRTTVKYMKYSNFSDFYLICFKYSIFKPYTFYLTKEYSCLVFGLYQQQQNTLYSPPKLANFLKLLMCSHSIIEKRSLIWGRQSKHSVNLDNATNYLRKSATFGGKGYFAADGIYILKGTQGKFLILILLKFNKTIYQMHEIPWNAFNMF